MSVLKIFLYIVGSIGILQLIGIFVSNYRIKKQEKKRQKEYEKQRAKVFKKQATESIKEKAWLMLEKILGDNTPKENYINGDYRLVNKHQTVEEMRKHDEFLRSQNAELVIDSFGALFGPVESLSKVQYEFAKKDLYSFFQKNVNKISKVDGFKDVLKFINE
jgi:hypothetical protein